LFICAADGKAPEDGALAAFCQQLDSRLGPLPDQDRARAAVKRLININRIRNGRLHTDGTNRAESLRRLGVSPGELPDRQWDRIRSAAIEAVYVIIELLQLLIA